MESTRETSDSAHRTAATPRRVAASALIAAVAIASAAYRVILYGQLDQTAALFIGLPALIAIVVVFAVSPRSATGVACKAVTVGLLVSMLGLWEGMLCVAMSAPLFYLVAVIVARLIEMARDRRSSGAWISCVAVLGVLPLSLEGVTHRTSLERREMVRETRVVTASSAAVAQAIFEAPRFDRTLPVYLRAGFPRPIATAIESRSTRRRWIVALRGGEMKINGMEPRTGDLVLELVETKPGFVRWRAVSDDSHMTHFLHWEESTVEWEPVGADATRVTWTLRYRRGLDPSWYFGPWERYAARLAAGYLIDAVATP
jgi:hypothetical protein